MTKKTVHHIVKTLGADAICSELGVTAHSVRYACVQGSFSASWYFTLKRMCDEVGIPCPISAFNWRASDKNDGNAPDKLKGAAQ